MMSPSWRAPVEDLREDLPDVVAAVEADGDVPREVALTGAHVGRTGAEHDLAALVGELHDRLVRSTEVRVDRVGAFGDGVLVGRRRVLDVVEVEREVARRHVA